MKYNTHNVSILLIVSLSATIRCHRRRFLNVTSSCRPFRATLTIWHFDALLCLQLIIISITLATRGSRSARLGNKPSDVFNSRTIRRHSKRNKFSATQAWTVMHGSSSRYLKRFKPWPILRVTNASLTPIGVGRCLQGGAVRVRLDCLYLTVGLD